MKTIFTKFFLISLLIPAAMSGSMQANGLSNLANNLTTAASNNAIAAAGIGAAAAFMGVATISSMEKYQKMRLFAAGLTTVILTSTGGLIYSKLGTQGLRLFMLGAGTVILPYTAWKIAQAKMGKQKSKNIKANTVYQS